MNPTCESGTKGSAKRASYKTEKRLKAAHRTAVERRQPITRFRGSQAVEAKPRRRSWHWRFETKGVGSLDIRVRLEFKGKPSPRVRGFRQPAVRSFELAAEGNPISIYRRDKF